MDYDKIAERWAQVAPELAFNGIDITAVKPLHQAVILGRLAREHDEGPNWREFADELLEEHPTWETLNHRRRRHATNLLDEEGNPSFGTTNVDELAKHRFAAVTQYRGRSGVYTVGDVDDDICSFVIDMFAQEDPEWVDRIVDLVTGNVYARNMDFRTVLAVTLNSARVEREI